MHRACATGCTPGDPGARNFPDRIMIHRIMIMGFVLPDYGTDSGGYPMYVYIYMYSIPRYRLIGRIGP